MISSKEILVSREQALPDRAKGPTFDPQHLVLGTDIRGPWPPGHEQALFGMGCFWGAERLFWQQPGVWTTAVGYAGGYTANPSYEDVCSGRTGHAEVVLVVFDPEVVDYERLLQLFWESHDPTQGMRQGNDRGTQYRSMLLCFGEQQEAVARASAERYGAALAVQGLGPLTTEIAQAGPFYYAEGVHQQYLARNPMGYCGLRGTGVPCPA